MEHANRLGDPGGLEPTGISNNQRSAAATRQALSNCEVTVWRWDHSTQGLNWLGGPPMCLTRNTGELGPLLLEATACEDPTVLRTITEAVQSAERFEVIVPGPEDEPEHRGYLIVGAPQFDVDGFSVAVNGCLVLTRQAAAGPPSGASTARAGNQSETTSLQAENDRLVADIERLETALGKARGRLKTVQTQLATVTLSTDAAGRVLEFQPEWLEFSGQAWSQAQGVGWLSAIVAPDRRQYQLLWDHACAHGTVFRAPVRMRRLGMRRELVQGTLTGAPVFDEYGQLCEWLFAFRQVAKVRDSDGGTAAQLLRINAHAESPDSSAQEKNLKARTRQHRESDVPD